MREPEPKPADQWSRWGTTPTIPGSWPGLGFEHQGDGFEIDRAGVHVVARQLLNLAFDAVKYDDVWVDSYVLPAATWELPSDLCRLMGDADQLIHDFWRDLHSEVGMAGLLIDRAATNYRLGDDPRLGDLSDAERDQRIVDMLPGSGLNGDFMGPSPLYPGGYRMLEPYVSSDYGIGQITAEEAKKDIDSIPDNGSGDGTTYQTMADSLVELANTLRLRAQDLRDAPWRGAAADVAQSALRQIYANVTALAAIVGSMSAARVRFLEVVAWCRQNFEQMADPHRSDRHEFWDFGGTPNSRARDFLKDANEKFFEAFDMMPKEIKEDLPGLMVTDAELERLRRTIADPADVKPWLWTQLPDLYDFEQAEKKYG
ncbi:hypothetical protein [Nonomuraea sp. NPDC002799]